MVRVQRLSPGRPIWFDLMTPKPEVARDFYAAVLGWKYDISGEEFGGYAMAHFDGAMAAGIGKTPPDQDFPSAWTVYFGCEDADATAQRITAAGGTIVAPPMDVGGFGRMAICQDPTGAVFGTWQPGQHKGAAIIDEPGGMAWCEVNSRDAKAAADFYCSVFGLTDRVTEMQGTPYHMLHHGPGPVCGALQMTDEWGDMPPHWMTYFAVPDIDKAKADVEAAGGTVHFGPFESPYGKILVAGDPTGAAISFTELTAR